MANLDRALIDTDGDHDNVALAQLERFRFNRGRILLR
jgi:hypothetical protein